MVPSEAPAKPKRRKPTWGRVCDLMGARAAPLSFGKKPLKPCCAIPPFGSQCFTITPTFKRMFFRCSLSSIPSKRS